jgi:hypothetical protein
LLVVELIILCRNGLSNQWNNKNTKIIK